MTFAALVAGLAELAKEGPAIAEAVGGLFDAVRAERPELITEAMPGLEDVERARAEAKARAAAG